MFGFAFFGQGNGRIAMTDLDCEGTEDSLLQCRFQSFTLFEGHFEDAGVRCFSTGRVYGTCTMVHVGVYGTCTMVRGVQNLHSVLRKFTLMMKFRCTI